MVVIIGCVLSNCLLFVLWCLLIRVVKVCVVVVVVVAAVKVFVVVVVVVVKVFVVVVCCYFVGSCWF